MSWQICFHDLGAIFSLWQFGVFRVFCGHFFELCDWLLIQIFGISWDLLLWKRDKWHSLCFRSAGYSKPDSSVFWVSCRCDWPQDTSRCCLVNGLEWARAMSCMGRALSAMKTSKSCTQCSIAQTWWLGVTALNQYSHQYQFTIAFILNQNDINLIPMCASSLPWNYSWIINWQQN